MKKHSKPEFDEREISARTRAFSHGFALLAFLLLIDAILGSAGVVWASGRFGGLILLAAANLAVHLECILRGVSNGRGPRRNIVILLASIVFIVSLNIFIYVRQGSSALAVDSQLTLYGSATIAQGIVLLTQLCDIAKIIFDLKRRKNKA